MTDIPEVGGKNASLGEMYVNLSRLGLQVPNGFAITAEAFRHFIGYNKLDGIHQRLLNNLDTQEYSNLEEIGAQAREMILEARMPNDLIDLIIKEYKILAGGDYIPVAVRSSATAEDLPDASFAGQHDSFLNIRGEEELIKAVKNCYASLYNNRAIKYREDKGFDHSRIYLSVGVQKMVRSDKGCSGIGFTLEPETGFRNVIHLAGVWGLGENIVQGSVSPDEFLLFKPSLLKGKNALIQKNLGSKAKLMIYGQPGSGSATLNTDTPPELRSQYVLSDLEIEKLGSWAMLIEDHYKKPMDIEWAKDGETGKLYILQARPETVHSRSKRSEFKEYKLKEKGEVLCRGQAIGTKIASGYARILNSPAEAGKLQEGDILITDMTSPDWDPILRKVSAIVTNKGGRTSHASIVARELGVAAVVGCGDATSRVAEGEMITVSCAEGRSGLIYRGRLEWEEKVIDFSRIKMPALTKVMMILGEPEKAFQLAAYPGNGVGLLRIEFIITHQILIHPLALIHFDSLNDLQAKEQIAGLTQDYPEKEKYFVDKLSQGVATIAAAFYPREVIVRMSDFKSNEYANLIGGKEFEPREENPMLGFRGASRYYSKEYREGFRLECEAMKIVREEMGFDNVKLMIPFCRTVEEGEKVISLMAEFGITRGLNGTEIYVMAEIPSNVILAEQFAGVFDGFSIGSNDLTQLTLGIDRDSELIAGLFDEQNPASKAMISTVVQKARMLNKPIGICGQAPSDFPDFTRFLVSIGIDSISFNPDALLQGIENINMAEASLPEYVKPEQESPVNDTENAF